MSVRNVLIRMVVSCCTGRAVTLCLGTGCETPGPPPLCIISYISLSKSAQIRAKPYRYRTKTVHFRTNSVHPSAGGFLQRGRYRGGSTRGPWAGVTPRVRRVRHAKIRPSPDKNCPEVAALYVLLSPCNVTSPAVVRLLTHVKSRGNPFAWGRFTTLLTLSVTCHRRPECHSNH